MPTRRTILVIGLGTFGQQAALALAEGGATVIALDRVREKVEAVAHRVTKAAALDATNEEALDTLGAFDVDAAIVGLGEFFDITVLVTHLLRRRRIREIVVQVNSQRQGEAIRAVGATEIVFPERDSARSVAERLASSLPFHRIAIGPDAGIVELPCPPWAVGRTLKELELRRHWRVSVVAIKTPAREEGLSDAVSIIPDAEAPLGDGQVLVVLGHNQHLVRFRAEFPAAPA